MCPDYSAPKVAKSSLDEQNRSDISPTSLWKFLSTDNLSHALSSLFNKLHQVRCIRCPVNGDIPMRKLFLLSTALVIFSAVVMAETNLITTEVMISQS